MRYVRLLTIEVGNTGEAVTMIEPVEASEAE